MTTKMNVQDIPLSKIWNDNDFNCREKVESVDVMELAKRIQREGLMHAVTVAPLTPEQREASPDPRFEYRLVAGYRRFQAHRILGYTEIPSNIRTDMVDEKTQRLFNLSENLHRKELGLLEEVAAIRPLKELGMTEKDIANELSRSRGWVQIRTMMMGMPQNICVEIEAYKLTNKQIRNLYSIHGTAGYESTVRALKEMKDGKKKGRSVILNPNHLDVNKPRLRTRTDILQLLDHLTTSGLPIGLPNRALAWACGNISDGELHRSLLNFAEEEGYVYHLPRDIHIEDLPTE
jgi:ParB/RepB/Spo0J family partition protein